MSVNYPYPPSNRNKGDLYGRKLPALPSKTPIDPRRIYAPEQIFMLSRPKQSTFEPELLQVSIRKCLDIGYNNTNQTVVAQVESGSLSLNGKNVVLKFYDPLYVNPDNLQSRPQKPRRISPTESIISTDTNDCETLVVSVEYSRKEALKFDVPAQSQLFWSRDQLEPSIGGRLRAVPRYKGEVEARSDFSHRCCQQEFNAYKRLKNLQGKSIAQCYGFYEAKFPNRELLEDRTCRVIVLELLDLKRLNARTAKSMSEDVRYRVPQEVSSILKLVFEHNLFSGTMELSNFPLTTANSIRMVGLSDLLDAEENGISAERMSAQERIYHSRFESELVEIGFKSVDE